VIFSPVAREADGPTFEAIGAEDRWGVTGRSLGVNLEAGMTTSSVLGAAAPDTCGWLACKRFSGRRDARPALDCGRLPGSLAFIDCKLVVGASKVRGP